MAGDPQHEEAFGERMSRCGQLGYAQLANELLKEDGGVMGDRERLEEEDVVDGCDFGDLNGMLMASAKASEGNRLRELGDGEAESERSLLLSSEIISSASCRRERGWRKGEDEVE